MIRNLFKKFAISFVLLSYTAYFFLTRYSEKVNELHGKQQRVAAKQLNASESIRIFCIIHTSILDIGLEERLSSIPWLHECEKWQFVEKIEPKFMQKEAFEPFVGNLMTVGLYYNATKNAIKGLHDVAVEHGEYDWYLKADDDTFVFMDNLKGFLQLKDPLAPTTFGYNLKTVIKYRMLIHHSGGAGYVLSYQAMKLIRRVDFLKSCQNSGKEDLDIALCLLNLGIKPGNSIDQSGRERFHPFDPKSHFEGVQNTWYKQHSLTKLPPKKDCCSEKTVSFHYMNASVQRRLYNQWKALGSNKLNFTNFLYNFLYI